LSTDKNTYWSVKNQEIISCVCCVLMITGFLFARGLLSVSMIVFFLNALHPQKIKTTWQQFKRSRFAIAGVIFFSTYFLSGLWSEDKANWFTTVQIKLPFIFLPFAMLDLPVKKAGFLKIIITSLLACLFAGMVYGFFFILTGAMEFRTGRHMPSPLEGDYIRFTIAIVLALLLVIYLYTYRVQYALSKAQIKLMLLWCIIAILYIHVQAAKSGLVSFYILIGMFILHNLVRKKRGLLIIFSMVAAVITAGIFLSKLPSVQKQMNDLAYEKKVWETKDTSAFNTSYSIVPRLISYEIAGSIVKEHPLIGVGAGDITAEIEHGYKVKYPGIRVLGRILPHNQFLCTALATGIPVGLFLLYFACTPIMRRKDRNIFMLTNTAIILFGMMIEPMLEVQFGVFVYLFFTLLWMQVPRYDRRLIADPDETKD
jgi:O-antigen ligase